MAITIADAFLQQLGQQACLYDLTYMSGRKRSAERVADFFRRVALPLLGVNSTIEVGAHEATFSLAIKKEIPQARVRAYEANPNVYAYFALGGGMEKAGVEYNYSAIGDKNGIAPFYIYGVIDGKKEPEDGRRHSLLLRVGTESIDEYSSVAVPIARLDSLCAFDPDDSVYALWVDAEGAGGQVLRGAQKVLERSAAVYVEMESKPKFTGQSCDRELMEYLLERGFVPVLRDFQFRHQYNAVFIKQELLAKVEHECHRYMQSVLRHELQSFFHLEKIPQKHVPVAPEPLPKLQFASLSELKDAIDSLPLLRASRELLNPANTVVACHASDLDEAVGYYKKNLPYLPPIYVLDDYAETESAKRQGLILHDFSELCPGMDVQLYFRPTEAPRFSYFVKLSLGMANAGFQHYGLEWLSTNQLYGRNKKIPLGDKEWDIIFNFSKRFADANSLYTYLAVCKARLEAEPGYIPLAGYQQYFHPLVHPEPQDVLCEGGMCDGESTAKIFQSMQGQGKIYAFEPVPDNFAMALKRQAEWGDTVVLEQKGLWSASMKLHLAYNPASPNSASVAPQGATDICDCVSIDDYFADKEAPKCIKLDVEGAEIPVLQGARNTLEKHLPKLLISIYHFGNGLDYINIPKLLLEMNLPYKYYCGHHRPWYNETILYAKKN